MPENQKNNRAEQSAMAEGQVEAAAPPEAEQNVVAQAESRWQKLKRMVKAAPAVARALWHDKTARQQIGEAVYTTLTTVGGVKLLTDFLRIPLGKKHGEAAGGDIYKKAIDIKERKEAGRTAKGFTEALIQTETIRHRYHEIKRGIFSELLTEEKSQLLEKDINYEELPEEEQMSVIRRLSASAKEQARKEFLMRGGQAKDLLSLDILEQKTKEMQAENEKLRKSGRLSQENSSIMKSQINRVYLEYKKGERLQEKKREKKVKEAVNNFIEDKVKGMRIARDAWNTFATVTGLGMAVPFLRGGGYIGLELTERLQSSHRKIKQQDIAKEYQKWRKITPETEDAVEDSIKAGEHYCRRIAVETTKAYWQDIRALGLKGRTKETEQLKGAGGTIKRTVEAAQSFGSVIRAGSLLLTGFSLEQNGNWSHIPEIINQHLEKLYHNPESTIFHNLVQNTENTIHNYQRIFKAETYVNLAQQAEKMFGPAESNESPLLANVAEAAVASAAATAKPPLFETHLVKKGESLWALASPIAKKSGVPILQVVENIKKENKLSSDILQINQELRLPTARSYIEQKIELKAEGLKKLPEIVKSGIGTPYSSENNCMNFLRHCFEKSGLDFSAKDFSYAGEMIEHLGKRVQGVNVANLADLKNHPGDYLIAFGHRYKPSNKEPALDTWNHAGFVHIDEDGSITLIHSSSESIRTTDGRSFAYNEYRLSNDVYYDNNGQRIEVVRHPGEGKDAGFLKNGWVSKIPLEEYLQNVKWTQVALSRLDGETVALHTAEQPSLDSNKFSPRQLKVMEILEEQPVEVLNKAKKRSEIYRCSADVVQRLRLISRGLPEALHLSIKGTAIIDAPQAEKAILSSGGNIAATLQDTIMVEGKNRASRLVFLEKFGQESTAYKQNAQEWLRQAAKDPLGFATFTHEGTSIEQQIIAGLPAGNGINSHLVLLLGERNKNVVVGNNQSVAECLERYFGLSHNDFQKSAWVFEGLGLKINGQEITDQAGWESCLLNKGDELGIKDIAFNDNVGGKVRTGSFISHFFLKDHTFHPVAVLRPNAKIMEQTLSSFELPVKVNTVHQVKEGESLADIFKARKVPPESWGDVSAYLYSQGIDVKNLRAGSLLSLPDLAELKNNHQAVIETAEHRLDEQSWVRREQYDSNVVVASADTPQKIIERLLDKKLSRQEAADLMRQIMELEKDKPDNEKTFLFKDGRIILTAGDVLTLPKQKIELFETALNQQRQKNLTQAPQELTLNIQGKDKTIYFNQRERNLINNIVAKNPELNGHIPEYLSAILAQEEKRGGWRKLAKDIAIHLEALRKIPILRRIIPQVHSVGIFQVRANELIVEKLQETIGEKLTLPELSHQLSNDERLNGLATAIMAQDHIDNLQNALHAFGQESGPGHEDFDLAVINSHNRGLNKTLFGVVELRIKDLAIASGESSLWQKYFNGAKISGSNKERDTFDDFFQGLALSWQKRGLLAVSPEQIAQDAVKIKTNLTDFLKSPTLQAFKQAYPNLKKGQEMLILPSENDINRPDFNACNYASVAAQSRLFAQMSGKRALS